MKPRIMIAMDANSKRVDFELDGERFHTNKNGEGLWVGYDYLKQIRGTMDFHLTQSTYSGKRKAIEKWFENGGVYYMSGKAQDKYVWGIE